MRMMISDPSEGLPGSSADPSENHQQSSCESRPTNLLPVLEYRLQLAEFLESKKSSPTVIIVGDTGSGKTTQIPQLLLDKVFDGFFNGTERRIAVTQPRRVAAVSVAERVASELDCKLGDQVGYSVRFDNCTSPNTKITYMTDGMLVREAQSGWMFNQYNLIVLDEVHERSLHTDILLGLVRKAQIRRRKFAEKEKDFQPLKVLLMSATMDLDHMKGFWKEAPALYIPGRTFPVEIKFTPSDVEDYLYASIVAVFQIHRLEPPGDVLVFLTGREEIEELIRRCKEIARSLPVAQQNIRFVPLYAALPTDMQMNAFKPTPQSIRKVIFSTNVAETSVTIQGIKYVIDSGRVKSKSYTTSTGMEVLKTGKISQAQAWQRTGRAGREQAGVCFRLYTEEEFQTWPPHPVPEIRRSNLSTVLLQLIAMGVDKPLSFPFFDRPKEENLRDALDQLVWLGAVTHENVGDDLIAMLTPDGITMAKFPLDPRYSRCLLRAKTHNCTEDMLTVIAMLSGDSPFFVHAEKRKEAEIVHQKFFSNEGDHVMMLNVWRGYKNAKESRAWCLQNFVNMKNMEVAAKIRKQLREVMSREKIPFSTAQSTTAVRRALCEGMFMKTAELLPDGSYITLDTKKPVFLHPSSCLFRAKPSCVVYNEFVQTNKSYIRELCLVEKEWVDAVGSKYFTEMRIKLAEASAKLHVTPTVPINTSPS